jgi:cytoskeletal protein RodZ
MASFGEKLRHEREMRGVSLRDIAEGTKISRRFLQALEEDRVDVLPGGLFPRAFVKQYAAFLGLDPDRAVADFVAAHGEPAPERRVAAPPAPPRFSLSPGQLVLAVLAVVVLAVFLRRPGEPDHRRAKAEPTPTPVAAAPAVLPTDRVVPAAAIAAARGDGIVITMKARQECWVEVRADGQTLVNRVLSEGESQTFEAQGEIVLSVGNAGGLQLLVNDQQALPLGRSGEVRKNIVITRQNLPSLVDEGRAPAADGQSG